MEGAGIDRDAKGDVVKIAESWLVTPETKDTPNEALSSGAFSRRSRLSPKALRLYEELGLLVPERVDPVTGYRAYRSSQLPVARLISMLRRLDMPLATIAEIVAAPRAEAADRLQAYWLEFEDRVAVQREVAAHLRRRLTYGDEASDLLRHVRVRDIPEQVVFSQQRHVLQQDLQPFLFEAIGRGVDVACERMGGVVGSLFVVFHGEVSFDSDGPVEVCVPVRASERNGRTVRIEPAHREAYLRVRKAQVGHPQILSAYDAVAAWINDVGQTVCGPPREVYFAGDFGAATPDAEVCDVAFPIESPDRAFIGQ